jgi:Ring finger domain
MDAHFSLVHNKRSAQARKEGSKQEDRKVGIQVHTMADATAMAVYQRFGANLTNTTDCITSLLIDLSRNASLYDHNYTLCKEAPTDGSTDRAFVFITITVVVGFVVVVASYMLNRRRLEREAAARQAAFYMAAVDSTRAQRQTQRYSDIESWLVTKKALEHDHVCECLQKQGNKQSPLLPLDKERSRAVSVETAVTMQDDYSVDGGLECPICMDEITAGCLVSWSVNTNCQHVFHHLCIKEWLRKRKNCPNCRECFLPIDEAVDPSVVHLAHVHALMAAQQTKSNGTFFCLEHKVVEVPSELAVQDESLVEKIRERGRAVPERTELSSMRGKVMFMQSMQECTDIETGLMHDTVTDETLTETATNVRVSNDNLVSLSSNEASMPEVQTECSSDASQSTGKCTETYSRSSSIESASSDEGSNDVEP